LREHLKTGWFSQGELQNLIQGRKGQGNTAGLEAEIRGAILEKR
jgi:hypothetical protein